MNGRPPLGLVTRRSDGRFTPARQFTTAERANLARIEHAWHHQGWSYRKIQRELNARYRAWRSLGMISRDLRELGCESCRKPPPAPQQPERPHAKVFRWG